MSSSRRLPGLPVFGSYDRSEIEEAEALNNIVEEDTEDEVMIKVTCSANRLLVSPDCKGLTDKRKTLTRT